MYKVLIALVILLSMTGCMKTFEYRLNCDTYQSEWTRDIYWKGSGYVMREDNTDTSTVYIPIPGTECITTSRPLNH